MPVHNAGDYLKPAVDSVLSQRDVQLELLIVDDHSTDNAISELAIAKLPANLTVRIIHSPDRGIVAALNEGIRQATMPFIARMDSDDIAAPKRLITQLNYLREHPNVDICGGKVEMIAEHPIGGGYAAYQQWINKLCTHEAIEHSFFIESPIPHPTALMRTALIRQLGGYHDCDWPEDYDLWCRALIAGKIFGKPSGDTLLQWRDHASRLSRSDTRYHKQQFLRCKAHYLSQYLLARDIDQCIIWGTGPTGLKLHDYLDDNGVTVRAFIDVAPKMQGRLKRGKPLIIVDREINPQGLSVINAMIIVAVSARGAREKIKDHLKDYGLDEMQNFIIAA